MVAYKILARVNFANRRYDFSIVTYDLYVYILCSDESF